MNVKQLFRCAIGRHVRSSSRSRIVNGRRESVCRGCGRRMIRDDFSFELTSAGVATLVPPEKNER
ncbi:MAG: hypothetical protein JWN66_4207 [Sphingomonas bacterium]|jgi:hypothetical protein|nr:hypothetical protein [Sphingomonas bacterium]